MHQFPAVAVGNLLSFLFLGIWHIALLIKLTSPGPVFYKQLRMTKDKKEFHIYKFRSMVQDAEKKSGRTLFLKDAAEGVNTLDHREAARNKAK